MKILFFHQNFPGQFLHLAPALARAGHDVYALSSRLDESRVWKGVQILSYRWEEPSDQRHHPWLTTLNRATHRGETCLRAAMSLKKRGVEPDVVIAHSGWGEALFLREVWPDARFGIFSELYYQSEGADIGFDPEFPGRDALADGGRLMLRNLSGRLQLEQADAGITPTQWQADSHPPELRRKISVIHDGINTQAVTPDPDAVFEVDGAPRLTAGDEVISFINRNLEPYRGFHVFMRNLPELLSRRPNARVVLIGGEGVSYGSAPKEGGSWKDVMLAEMGRRLTEADWARVHFVGKVPYDSFVALMQIATAHVYLTYPFVLSWSLLEAMSAGAPIVASDTAPVREVLRDRHSALLVDFFDGAGLVDRVDEVCSDPALGARLGAAARKHVVENYDLETVCLPRQFAWFEALAAGRPFTGSSPESEAAAHG
ncbi:glycosyltransferase [Tranquillimonas rosea]|uniref:glycosyltransferase n=1 Tax=Tranquillimonas rosea TaxID=641238 RepID=UPI003BAB7E66